MGVIKKYSIVYADPPWRYGDSGCNGAAEEHYDTMSLKQICDLPIRDLCEDDCVLFIWATYPLLKEALQVIESWGFEYKSIAFQWIKLNRDNGKPFYGLGRWTRGNSEPCLIATRGKPKRISESVFQLIHSKLGMHSRKPAEARRKIVQLMGDLPKIELFARERIEGWDVWGDEAPKETQMVLKPKSSGL